MRLGYRIRIRMGLCRWIHYDVACMSVLDERTSVLMPRFRKISRLRIVFLAFSYHDYISCTWLLYTVVFANDLVEFFIFFCKAEKFLVLYQTDSQTRARIQCGQESPEPPPPFHCVTFSSFHVRFVYLIISDSYIWVSEIAFSFRF